MTKNTANTHILRIDFMDSSSIVDAALTHPVSRCRGDLKP